LSLRTEFNTQEWVHSLQTVLGFECFGIASATYDKILAAGTCTLRNPCYLLAKLKMPFALDDPRLLAVITAPAIEQPELFFHYRQYSLSTDSPMSILLYPAVSIVKRLESFKLINSLVGGVSYGIDPRTVERARRIFQGIIRPLIEQKSHYKKAINLELADIGSGSGGLSAAICRKIYSLGVTPKLSLWFVDLEPADPARFFRNDKLRVFTDNLNFIGDDYRDWLTRPRPLPVKNGLRLALISNLFNNLSSFSVHCLSAENLPLFLEHDECSELEKCRPSVCLAPHGTGVESLAISSTQFQLPEGRTFSQASLSKFYQGLYLLSGKADSGELPENGLFLPVRSFNPECLVTSNGKSVISCLVEECDYIIIEDADLRPQDLIDHARRYSLGSLTICDMTKALKLKSIYLYIIRPGKVNNLQLTGDQIW